MKLLIDQETDEQRKKRYYLVVEINEMLDKQLYLTRLESKNRDMYFDHVG